MGILRDVLGRVLLGREMNWLQWRMVRRRKLHKESLWTPVNQGDATWTTQRDKSVTLFAPATASPSLRCWVQTAPTPPWGYTVNLRPLLVSVNHIAGVLVRESSTWRLHSIHLDGTGVVSIVRWTSPTALSLTDDAQVWTLGDDCWLTVEDDTVNRSFRISSDYGSTNAIFFSVARTTFLTADQWGIFVSSSVAYDAYATFFSALRG